MDEIESSPLQELLEENDEEEIENEDEELQIAKTKIMKTVFNPNITFSEINEMSVNQFLAYSDIDSEISQNNKKVLRQFISDAWTLRENIDSLLHGNIDMYTTTMRDILTRVKNISNAEIVDKYKPLIRSYVTLVVQKVISSPSPLSESQNMLKSSSPAIEDKTEEERLSTVVNQPENLIVVKADKDHFYVIGKSLSKYRNKLLNMGGVVPKKRIVVFPKKVVVGLKSNEVKQNVFRKDIVKFPNYKKKEIKKFVFSTQPDKIKARNTFYKYSRRKFKIYLDAAILYMEYHTSSNKEDTFVIDYKNIIDGIAKLYKCSIPPEKLKEENENILENTFSLNSKILNKLTNGRATLTSNANSLLTSIVFYQADIIKLESDIQENDYNGLIKELERRNKLVMEKKCPSFRNIFSGWLACCVSAIYNTSKRFSDNEEVLGARLIDYCLQFIISLKRRQNALKYTEDIRQIYKNSSNKDVQTFFREQQIFYNPSLFSKTGHFADNEALVTMGASVHYLMSVIKNSTRIQLRVKAFA